MQLLISMCIIRNMKTEVWKIDANQIDARLMARAGQILKEGGLVAFPTETVYGLGGDAFNQEAAAKIYAAKGRPSDNPLIVHIAELKSLERVAAFVPEQAKKLAEVFWPGPLTMIFQKKEAVPMTTTGGLDTVAVRMPAHPAALALIRAAGGFIAAPSANASGRPSPTTAAHVKEDLDGRIPLILDGGKVQIGLESTIVDMTGQRPVILRPGYITQEKLEEVIGSVETDRGLLKEDAHVRPKAPGMKYRHYAPRAEMFIVEGQRDKVTETIAALVRKAVSEGKRPGVLATEETADCYPGGIVRSAGSRQDAGTVAASLFAVLRAFDHAGVDVIYSESFSDGELGQAIMNRLLKAAGHNEILV